jgi:hypothetical protein
MYFLVAIFLFVATPLLMGRVDTSSIGFAAMTGGLMIPAASRTRKAYFGLALLAFLVPTVLLLGSGSIAFLGGLAMVLFMGGLLVDKR